MGSVNHGNQTITWGYFQEATAANWGKRLLGELPVGIYSGGYLTRVTDSRVSLSTFAAELRDTVAQINVNTAVAATLDSTTLDSGTISSATPYLIMRWVYDAVVANYVEIHAIAALTSLQQNDIVIGKCVFSGSTLSSFDYSDRTFPQIESQTLKVEATSAIELYVQIRGGKFNTGNALLKIGDQKVGPFVVPGLGLSRIDLVYINFDGSVAIQQGTAAVSPSVPGYIGKLVLAEVKVVNGDINITWDRITDCRSFLQHPVIVDGSTMGITAGGKLYAINDIGSKRYDSGWFSVGLSNTYVKTHGLGSSNLITTLLFAPDSGGAPDLTNIIRVDFHSISPTQEYGGVIQQITSSQFIVATAGDGIAFKMINGDDSPYTSGWYKVLALRMD